MLAKCTLIQEFLNCLNHTLPKGACNSERGVIANMQDYLWSPTRFCSAIGPLLFLIIILLCVNDLIQETMLDGHYITLYADDMLLYRVIHSAEDFTHVQKGIDNIGNWVQGNHLKLNSNKCKCMVVSRRRSRAAQILVLRL